MATKNPKDEKLIVLFGQNVRRVREEKGMTMNELAYKCEVEYGTISTIERAIVNCSITTAYRISKALEVPLDYLIAQDS